MKDSLHWKNLLDRLTRQHLDQVGKMLAAARKADRLARAVKRAGRNFRRARSRERKQRADQRPGSPGARPINGAYPFEGLDRGE